MSERVVGRVAREALTHVVFTLPDEVSALALQNQRLCYGLLFRAASRTLRTIAADPAHLGAEIGLLAVLHTWSQTLLHHPHVHCVVPAGGIAPRRQALGPLPPGFFLPVRVLSRLFRRFYLADLQKAFGEGELALHVSLASLREPHAFARWIGALRAKEWIVYAKPPFGGPVLVLEYLARYTHRVAIANSRLVAIDGEHVRFLWKDGAHGGRSAACACPASSSCAASCCTRSPRASCTSGTSASLQPRPREEAGAGEAAHR